MKKIFFLLCCSTLSSCSIFQPPKLNSYYKKVEGSKIESSLADAQKVVEVNSFYIQPDLITPPKEEFKNSLSLLDRGQEKYIEILGNEFKGKPEEFIKNIAAPFKTSVLPKNESILDKSEFHIKLNLNIIDKKNDAILANRISNFKVNLVMQNYDVSFVKFDNIQTKYEVLDFGKLSNTNAQNISLNAGADIILGTTTNAFNPTGGITNTNTTSNSPTLGLSLGASNSNSQEVLLSKRVLSQNAALTRKFAYISLEGTPTNNLEGPLNIEFTLKPDSIQEHSLTKFEKLFDKEKPLDQNALRSYTIFYQIPYIKQDITLKMTYEYSYREVLKNHNTVTESDDHIVYHNGKPTEEIIIIGAKKADLKINAFFIWDENSKKYLAKENTSLGFASIEEADAFRKWLFISGSNKIQNKNLTLIDEKGNIATLPSADKLDLIILPINLYELNNKK